MRPRRKMMAGVTAAVLLMSGIVLTLMSSTVTSAADGAPIIAVENESDGSVYELTVNVICTVDGARVTITGVNVTVYTVNITEDEDTTTIVIEKVAEGLTDADGNVTFDLPCGKYLVCGTYQGLHGFGEVDLTENQMSSIILHGGRWNHMDSQRLHFRNGTLSVCETASQEMRCNGTFGTDGIQDRDRDRVSDRCGGWNGGGPN